MLELKFLLSNIDLVIKQLERRKKNNFNYITKLLYLNQEKKKLISNIEKIRFQKNNLSSQVKELKIKNEEIQKIIENNQISKKKLKKLEEELIIIKDKMSQILLNIPNIPHKSVPLGNNFENNIEMYKFGEPKKKNKFRIKDHVELNKKLNIFDFEKATKITGSRFVVLKGLGAKLERALINFMIDIHIQKGYKEVLTPFIINESSMLASGQLPKFKKEVFKLNLTKYNWYLNPTAEVPIINLHRNELIEEHKLPIKYVGYTTCFRQEAGASGQDTRGILRQKQFNKVELVQFVKPQYSYMVLEEMLKDSEEILKKLNIPYRVVLLSTGDLGFSMSKTYDIEVWLPGQQKYREISSISNAETFQTVRANIKFKENNKNEYLHTLNASALAIGRTMIAIIENYQNEDGTISIPKVLIPYMKTDIINYN